MLLNTFTELTSRFLPVLIVLTAGLVVLSIINYLLKRHWRSERNTQFRFQAIMLSLSMMLALAIILTLPISDSLRSQLLSLLGILLSAAIALSSTTFIGNMLAGIMLRTIKSARPGDFVTVMNITGRITEMGLLRTEIQTEDRDLVTIPNLLMVNQPVKVVRSSGTIVSAEVSLGYDVSRVMVDQLLRKAAEKAGLQDAFVQVRELGDFSVLYRVAGLLIEVTSLLSARSKLRAAMLDTLHEANIEIVSPSFMNTRPYTSDDRFIPKSLAEAPTTHDTPPEDIAFDKAELAAAADEHRQIIEDINQQLDTANNQSTPISAVQKKALLARKERLEIELATLESTAVKD